jgi:hypothetical protein
LGIVAQDIIRFSSAKSENEKQAYHVPMQPAAPKKIGFFLPPKITTL